ncbi:MAG: hypothetical protein P4N60_22120 [Verrucomicrobiae bacterium]|nr:hypothetical protein [Verrucomicrobiae bacterium]
MMAIPEKSVLVRRDTVETFCGLDGTKISHMIDEGRFRWVWDFNMGEGCQRELRFLALEIFRPEITKPFTLENAIKVVLGETRQNFGGGEIVRRLRISRPSLNHLYHKGNLPGVISGGTITVARPALETFLRTRWIGGRA